MGAGYRMLSSSAVSCMLYGAGLSAGYWLGVAKCRRGGGEGSGRVHQKVLWCRVQTRAMTVRMHGV